MPAVAGAQDTIEVGARSVTRIGAFDTTSTQFRSPVIRKAIRALGKPSNRFRTSDSSCAVKWRRLGLRIVFANFGEPGAPPCGGRVGRAQSFTVQASDRLQTWKGLRVGMPESSVQQLHSGARFVDDNRFYPDGWWLKSARDVIGGGGRFPIVEARVRDGVVAAFDGWIGAAGD